MDAHHFEMFNKICTQRTKGTDQSKVPVGIVLRTGQDYEATNQIYTSSCHQQNYSHDASSQSCLSEPSNTEGRLESAKIREKMVGYIKTR